MKRSTHVFIVVTTAIVLLGFGSPAKATPIRYEVSGIASGTIGASTFTSVLVAVMLTGDTSNVVETFSGFCPVGCFVNVGTATVSIPGIGTATITDPTAIYSFGLPVTIDPTFPVLPYVIIGTLDNPPATDSFTGVGGVGSNAFLGYDLLTPIGPITASPGGVGYPTSLFLHTTLGNLAFTSNILPTTQGTLTATAVPEPSSLLLFGVGFVAFVGARLRQNARMRSR